MLMAARKAWQPRLRPGKKAGPLAGVAGLSAVGTVAGSRRPGRCGGTSEYIEDAYVGEDFALLEADRWAAWITTPDGVPLVVLRGRLVTALLTVVVSRTDSCLGEWPVPLPARRPG